MDINECRLGLSFGLFLPFQITDLQHSVLSPLSFRLDYKRGTTTTPTMFQRQVRMQVNISDISENSANSDLPVSKPSNSTPVHAITFTLLSGKQDWFLDREPLTTRGQKWISFWWAKFDIFGLNNTLAVKSNRKISEACLNDFSLKGRCRKSSGACFSDLFV